MTLAAFIVFVVAVLVISGLHTVSLMSMLKRRREHDALDEERQRVIYNQQKASQHELNRQGALTEQLAKESHALAEDTRLMHARVDGFFSHPEVKRMFDAGASGRGG